MREQFTPKFIERFWSHVDSSAGPDACWLWKLSYYKNGYGQVGIQQHGKTKTYGTHRVSWILTNGEIPEGMFVCHNCPGGDNRACCNPAHLWLGTVRDNVMDAISKGTAYIPTSHRGPAHPNAKLTHEQHQELMALKGKTPARVVALMFDLHPDTVSRHWRGVLY